MIYADYNATTPCLPEVADLVHHHLLTEYGNPGNRASLLGRRALAAVDTARARVAGAMGAFPDEIIFTSGATEACNLAILGAMQRLLSRRPRILTSAIEHPAVCMPAAACAEAGAQWEELPVDAQGRLQPETLAAALDDRVALVCVMAANNETGVLQELRDLVRLTHDAGALFFCDMTQLLGKRPFSVHAEDVDLACVSGHKCYGPKGVGALYKRRGLALAPLLHGGGQEQGLRSGTENVPGIAGFGLAADRAAREVHTRAAHLQRLSRMLEAEVLRALPRATVQSAAANRIPGTSMFSHPGLRGKWLAQLSDVAATSGSACASLHDKPSHVLRAMGVPAETAACSVRISLGLPTTPADVRHIARRLIEGARRLGAS